ncbi:MAG TPA: DUF1254 domain-containing protein [Blastococcus sp.]|nr:DUF1254 domain-containing protein [Blastococcus sp.]
MDEDTANAIASEAYTYLYPLVLMDVTRRQMTNVEQAGESIGRGPANAFTHVRQFPPATFRDVVRPNFDTLYSLAWLRLDEEPMIVSVPEAGDRYYLLPMLDMWTDVFHSPGTRTTGNGVAHFGLTAPGWEGKLPDGVQRVLAPTPDVWVIGRTQCNGPADYEAVNRFQDQMALTPLSRWGHPVEPVQGKVDPTVDATTPPLRQVFALSPQDFFAYAAALLKVNPPHPVDYPVLARMERLGLVTGQDFDLTRLPPVAQEALAQAVPAAQRRITARQKQLATTRNGWQIISEGVGVFGADYLKRATVDLIGLGANIPEDAVYPICYVDGHGQPFTGAKRYVVHFEARDLPPVRAFWSLTMYDAEGFPVPNPLDRCAIGDRDDLVFGPDGSLDLYIQHDRPTADQEANWLPAPAGAFNLIMRLYYPAPAVLDGRWTPPEVDPAD